MECADDWPRARTSRGAQIGFILCPGQRKDTSNLHVGQKHKEERERGARCRQWAMHAVDPVNGQERDLSPSAFMHDATEFRAAVSSGLVPLATG
eukprot:3669377-Pyramimonas_sp.AAC.1